MFSLGSTLSRPRSDESFGAPAPGKLRDIIFSDRGFALAEE